MTAKRLRAHRPEPHKPYTLQERLDPSYELAPNHFDGDGCVFPNPDHFMRAPR